MFSPTRRCLQAVAIVAVLGLAASAFPWMFAVWRAGAWLCLACCLIDALLAVRRPALQVERQMAGSFALGVLAKVVLRFQNSSRRLLRVKVHDRTPASFVVEDLPRLAVVQPRGWAEVPFWVTPTERGAVVLAGAEYRVASPFGLWWRRIKESEDFAVRVYPNFKAVAKFAMLATDNRVSQLGIRQRQRRGQGMEFHQLREYRVGDTLRQIDWRATSRMRKVISREYRDERDQQIVFLLDCGRRMHAREGGLFSHLDHALDAVLLLAYVALRQGDAVGLMTFGGEERSLAPRKGTGYLNALLNTVFDLASTTDASDTYRAVETTLNQLKKRSLLVLVSNIRDEQDEELISILRLAQRRHLVLLASLREQVLGEALSEEVRGFESALRLAATHHYLAARAQAHQRLKDAGVFYVDVEPRSLPVALVNNYLAIKASGAL